MSGPSRIPGKDELRASDADRDRVVDTLADAVGEGRLTLEEYSERSATALGARTLGELDVLTADIPDSSSALARDHSGPGDEEITAVLGNESRKGPWVVPPHLAVRSVLGDCHLEMQHAVLRGQVTTIDVVARFGSVTLFVPEGIEVRMSGRAVLGAKSSDLQGELRPGAPVLNVRCDVFCGAVTVRKPKFFMR
jgi:hypothetical protein